MVAIERVGRWLILAVILAATFSLAEGRHNQISDPPNVPDAEPPRWLSQRQSSDTPFQGETVLLYAKLQDDIALGTALLSTNETGFWVNWTDRYMSPSVISRNGRNVNETWAVFPWRNPSAQVGATIGWRVLFNDTAGKWNTTAEMAFTIREFKFITSGHNSTVQVCKPEDFPVFGDCDRTSITEALKLDFPTIPPDESIIEVRRGTYFESVNINKFNVRILAVNGTENTFVDAQGAPFAFKFTRIPAQADRILGKVINFTIRNADFGVFVDGHDNVVRGLNISSLTGPGRGVEIVNANNNTVSSAFIEAPEGIVIDPSLNITVTNITVRAEISGFLSFSSRILHITDNQFFGGLNELIDSEEITVERNWFNTSTIFAEISTGVSRNVSFLRNFLEDSNIEVSDQSGLTEIVENRFMGGIIMVTGGGAQSILPLRIKRNNISISSSGLPPAIYFDTVSTGNVEVTGNRIRSSPSGAACIDIYSLEGGSKIIENNTLEECHEGMILSDILALQILNNTIRDTPGSGLNLNNIVGAEAWTISGNSIINTSVGLLFSGGDTLTDIILFHNNFINNLQKISGTDSDPEPVELSFQGEGNFWDRTVEPCFIAGADSERLDQKDSHPYCQVNGWELVKDSTFAIVGPSGASVSLASNNASVIIPPDIFPEDTSIVIRGFDPVSSAGFVVRSLTDNASLVYEFTASQTFTQNVTVTIRFDPNVVAGNFAPPSTSSGSTQPSASGSP
jgi:hypothetical protein